LEYPQPLALRALLDTGAAVTVVSRTFARNWKLFQTNEAVEIRALGASHKCGEYAAAVGFPGTGATNNRPDEDHRSRLHWGEKLCLSDRQGYFAQLGHHV
jgi:hypothetical protein